MLNRTEAQLNDLIRELYAHPRHVCWTEHTLELGSHWNDLARVAALMSLTRVMPLPDVRFDRRAVLQAVHNKLSPDGEVAGCVFVLRVKDRVMQEQREFLAKLAPSMRNAGGYLRSLLWYYEYGMLRIHPTDRKYQLEKLFGCVLEAREQASRARGDIELLRAI